MLYFPYITISLKNLMFYLIRAILPLLRHRVKLMRHRDLERNKFYCIFAIRKAEVAIEYPHMKRLDLSVLINA